MAAPTDLPIGSLHIMLRSFQNGKFVGSLRGYAGTHVDDLLAIAPWSLAHLIEKALGQAFPIDEWAGELFSYLGSEICYGDGEVILSQQASCESVFRSNGVLFFLRKGADIRSNFWIVDICDRHIGVIPSFLHSRSRELESGNPP